ncbi:hypothetical protein SAMN05216276_101076 [Streptosporangium subroseum]|uniref:Ig-like domain (Group 3) n=1 Tax=Streptosporangium subroseum TaxID=106412 RepID=A0A239EWY7_9ACTN|nr:hypothetical protein [Streptosporangium subroseum]SNS48334.1 hypothetical protein SAMN05216276_101076 [Streptosporangium subroseum]
MRFAKPFTATVLGATLIALPFAGSALADSGHLQPIATVTKDAQPKPTAPSAISLKVAVNPGQVRQGGSYTVSIVAKGAAAGATATVKTPEGRSYQVTIRGRQASKTLTVPSNARPGSKTVTVTVGSKITTAEFTVTTAKNGKNGKKHDVRD